MDWSWNSRLLDAADVCLIGSFWFSRITLGLQSVPRLNPRCMCFREPQLCGEGFFLRRGVAGSSLEFGAGILVQR